MNYNVLTVSFHTAVFKLFGVIDACCLLLFLLGGSKSTHSQSRGNGYTTLQSLTTIIVFSVVIAFEKFANIPNSFSFITALTLVV